MGVGGTAIGQRQGRARARKEREIEIRTIGTLGIARGGKRRGQKTHLARAGDTRDDHALVGARLQEQAVRLLRHRVQVRRGAGSKQLPRVRRQHVGRVQGIDAAARVDAGEDLAGVRVRIAAAVALDQVVQHGRLRKVEEHHLVRDRPGTRRRERRRRYRLIAALAADSASLGGGGEHLDQHERIRWRRHVGQRPRRGGEPRCLS